MIQSFFYTSENKNLYIYDDQSRLSMLAHPELKKTSEKLTDVNSYYALIPQHYSLTLFISA